MSLSSFQASSIAASCRANASAAAESFNLCFDRSGELVVGDSQAWGEPPEGLAGPGLAVRIGTAEGGMVALIPAGLPLPDWYTGPNDSQKSRLRTLAAEWAVVLLPEDLMAEVTEADAVTDLAAAAAECLPDGAELIPLTPVGSSHAIYLLTPVTRLAQPSNVAIPAPAKPPAPAPVAPATRAEAPAATPAARPATDQSRQRLARLLNVPVQVVVRLAEKKIEMGQVVSLAPGAMITFGKNCEDLLDLYVNNRLYCRGEAVKIGEHFGLKVNEVGAVKVREERVF